MLGHLESQENDCAFQIPESHAGPLANTYAQQENVNLHLLRSYSLDVRSQLCNFACCSHVHLSSRQRQWRTSKISTTLINKVCFSCEQNKPSTFSSTVLMWNGSCMTVIESINARIVPKLTLKLNTCTVMKEHTLATSLSFAMNVTSVSLV